MIELVPEWDGKEQKGKLDDRTSARTGWKRVKG
ncbi:hypothetical protein J2S17_002329 [Cytobacillus purgationiresistens]|uniref:Uncharacterized protein n=1 Tax=Cytobacillus purgationiresistens TaxID=863449 RepID=A0ABU0AHT4_9BACI|nr:hypothetical protein [Cytobacillus purgationiresistens]